MAVEKISRFVGAFIGNLLSERALALLILAGHIDFACLYAIMKAYNQREKNF